MAAFFFFLSVFFSSVSCFSVSFLRSGDPCSCLVGRANDLSVWFRRKVASLVLKCGVGKVNKRNRHVGSVTVFLGMVEARCTPEIGGYAL